MGLSTGQFGQQVTPAQTLIDAMAKVDDCECVVVIMCKSDGIYASWSDGDSTMRLGMAEIAKIQMFEMAQLGGE